MAMKKEYLSYQEVDSAIGAMWNRMTSTLTGIHHTSISVYPIPRGGVPVAFALFKYTTSILIVDDPAKADVFVDDIIDSGKTRDIYDKKYGKPFYALFNKLLNPNLNWLVFPWEHKAEGDDSISDSVLRILEFIGEDVTREGLLETPDRVVKSWQRLYGGYSKDPKDVMKVFEGDGCDQMVLLKDIEFYSTCEHHLLPFYGKAHIAYIPGKKVLGISKLARLLEIYARRAQIQERIGDQVTTALMEYLDAKGAACVLEAQHFCMTSRGVEKQHSVMTTSSLKGDFLTEASCRSEFMGLIK